jgi:hypothetical protein
MNPESPVFIPKQQQCELNNQNTLIKPDHHILIINKLNQELNERDQLLYHKLKEITYWKSQYDNSVRRYSIQNRTLNHNKFIIDKLQKQLNEMNIENISLKNQNIELNSKLHEYNHKNQSIIPQLINLQTENSYLKNQMKISQIESEYLDYDNSLPISREEDFKSNAWDQVDSNGSISSVASSSSSEEACIESSPFVSSKPSSPNKLLIEQIRKKDEEAKLKLRLERSREAIEQDSPKKKKKSKKKGFDSVVEEREKGSKAIVLNTQSEQYIETLHCNAGHRHDIICSPGGKELDLFIKQNQKGKNAKQQRRSDEKRFICFCSICRAPIYASEGKGNKSPSSYK